MSRNSRVPAARQLELIMECRRSGKTDAQWCIENDIYPGTFYNWVSKLRKKGCEIPESIQKDIQLPTEHHDVVLLDVLPEQEPILVSADSSTTFTCQSHMTLEVNGASLSIPNGTDPVLLSQVIYALRGVTC